MRKKLTSLLLEAEEGAEVVICTEMPYDPVLSFNTCSQIVLWGLTCGHEVEPGYCTGSVIYTEHSDNITINQCRLYGSGTYGVESYSSSGIYVTDTDIYDCSYGLVYLKETSFAEFRNCISISHNGKENEMNILFGDGLLLGLTAACLKAVPQLFILPALFVLPLCAVYNAWTLREVLGLEPGKMDKPVADDET